MKIVVLDGFTENPGDLSWSGFAALGELTVYDRTPEDKIVERIGTADVVITNKTPISEAILNVCPGIAYIGVLATGCDIVDSAAARARGIPVTNIPAYGTKAVAQFAIGLLLEICHHIGEHNRAVRNGEWARRQDFCFWDYPLIELDKKTMGIIGFGRIGQATAQVAASLGMKVLAYDTYESESGRQLAKYVSLDRLLSASDVITLHAPLTPDTEGIINRNSISRMKDGVIILNNSRGALIVEQDLADALNEGKVFAAGLDVVRGEPIAPDNPLLQAKNCIITPHISWAPRESRQRLMDTAVNNLVQFAAGRPLNVVN